MRCWYAISLGTIAAMLTAGPGLAQTSAAGCAAIDHDSERLRCYDRAHGLAVDPSAGQPPVPSRQLSIWEQRLLDDAQQKTFTLTDRKPNYILYSHQDDVNRAPYTFTGEEDKIENQEIKFQLSLQTKMVDDLFGRDADLWFGYTQVSYWQLFGEEFSSPFRETNHEPEVFVSFLTDVPVLGARMRTLNLGLVHQSNGRSEPLSRSWNRVYAEAILVHGNFGLSVKPWYRIKEDEEDDDNPDIDDYLGHYELRGFYHWNNHVFSVMGRNLFDSEDRRNLEMNWTFPIANRLRGLVQWYKGYGENLIDYDFESNRISVGLMLTDWL